MFSNVREFALLRQTMLGGGCGSADGRWVGSFTADVRALPSLQRKTAARVLPRTLLPHAAAQSTFVPNNVWDSVRSTTRSTAPRP
jgi:hypothetical protein